jgi:outer membrane lipoprotein SlyB
MIIAMYKRAAILATILWIFTVIAGCASQRPLLSSNAHLARVGPDVAGRDIDECIERAEVASSEGPGTTNENVVAGAAGSSVVGAAAGGAGGAVVGNAARGAAAGAAGGAVASLTSALLRGLFAPKPPDPSFRAFADRCLREKGYEPAGWK